MQNNNQAAGSVEKNRESCSLDALVGVLRKTLAGTKIESWRDCEDGFHVEISAWKKPLDALEAALKQIREHSNIQMRDRDENAARNKTNL